MAIEFDCSCGQHLSVPETQAGRSAFCPACRKSVPIPGGEPQEPENPSGEEEDRSSAEAVIVRDEAGAARAIKFSCACGKHVSVPLPPPRKVGRCPACGRKLAVPRRSADWGPGLGKGKEAEAEARKDAPPEPAPPEPDGKPASEAASASEAATEPRPQPPASARRQAREAADRVADRLRPAVKQRALRARAVPPKSLRRLAAFALDAAASAGVFALAAFAARLGGAAGTGQSLSLGAAGCALFAAVNEVLFAARARARSLGKRLAGIEVVDGAGRTATAGLLLGRALAKIVLLPGAVFVLFDRDRRALHDIVCGTRVIELPP